MNHIKIKLFEQLVEENNLLKNKIQQTDKYLSNKENILFITTSNRWGDELPKSTQIAYYLKEKLKTPKIIEIPKLNIYPCEGNVSTKGNNCGVKDAL